MAGYPRGTRRDHALNPILRALGALDRALRRVETAGEHIDSARVARALFVFVTILLPTLAGALATFIIPAALESVEGVPMAAIAATLHMAGFFRALILLVGGLCAVFGVALAAGERK